MTTDADLKIDRAREAIKTLIENLADVVVNSHEEYKPEYNKKLQEVLTTVLGLRDAI